jgi:2,4-diaminopentanoate dehydrogenase
MRAAALAGNATLHGTGIAPGGISEKFPLLLSVMSTGLTFVRAEEFSDMRTYDAPDVLRHVMGFGDTPENALTGPMQKMLDSGFIQAVRMVVDAAGFKADAKVRATQEVAVATAPIDSPMGPIQPGQVAARKFHWVAVVDDEPVVRITVNWFMGQENLDPAWGYGEGGERYEMEVRGTPDFNVTIKGFQPETVEEGLKCNPGVVATAAHCVNSIPAVCAAQPGIATYLDLPLISGKAAPWLSR